MKLIRRFILIIDTQEKKQGSQHGTLSNTAEGLINIRYIAFEQSYTFYDQLDTT